MGHGYGDTEANPMTHFMGSTYIPRGPTDTEWKQAVDDSLYTVPRPQHSTDSSSIRSTPTRHEPDLNLRGRLNLVAASGAVLKGGGSGGGRSTVPLPSEGVMSPGPDRYNVIHITARVLKSEIL